MDMADSKVKQPRDDISKDNEDDKPSLKEAMLNIFQGEDFENTFKPIIKRMVSVTLRESVATEIKSLDIKNLVESNTCLVKALKTKRGSVEDVKEQVSSADHENTSDSAVEPAQLPSVEDDSDEKDFEIAWRNLADNEIDEAWAEGYGKKHGTHAVLCIDTSGSMNEGDAWSHVKQFYNGFLDGMEKLKEQDAHHDNIALVTFGHETKVQQRLTKDLTSLRGKLDDITPKGPSPLFGGLVMAAAAARTSRFSFAIVNHLHVTPKIILVTDGRPTELDLLDGEDVADPTRLQQTKKIVFNEVEKLRREQIDLHCIYVGQNADHSFLRTLQSDTVQELMSYRDGEKMALYTVLKCAREGDQRFVRYDGDENTRKPPTPDIESLLRTLMQMLPGGYRPDQNLHTKNKMIPEATRLIADEEPSSVGCKTSTITLAGEKLVNVYHEINDGKHPPTGTRVRRGNDWMWGDQDNDRAGTIIGHATDPSDNGQCWVHVEWDDDSKMKGNRNVYRFKIDDTMEGDVTITGEERVPPEGKVLAVGCKVKPGKGFVEGNKNKEGVVIRFYGNLAEVKWNDGTKNKYRFGSPESEIVPVMDPERRVSNKKELPVVKKDVPNVQLTEQIMAQIADTIGFGWQRVGTMLGIDNVRIAQITEDNNTTVLRVTSILNMWRRKEETPTLDKLVKVIKGCGADYNIDRLQEIIEEIRGGMSE